MLPTRVLAPALGVILLAVAGCAGCGGDESRPVDGSDGGRPAHESTTTTTDPVNAGGSTTTDGPTTTELPAGATVEDDVVARYKAFWEARFAANSPPDPDDPALREYATGDALEETIAETQANDDAGVEFRANDDPAGIQRVDVVSVEGDQARVQECVVDDVLIVRRSDGSVVNDEVRTYNVDGQMRRVDGEWRLASFRVVQRWEGVAGCALAD